MGGFDTGIHFNGTIWIRKYFAGRKLMSSLSGIWENSIIAQLITKAIVVFCCFPVHECAHAWMAAKLGDHTAEREGRITLNPFKHLDLWGTIMLLAFGMGYAKSVPVNPNNFRRPKKDSLIVSLAGPMSNLIMAVVFLLIEHIISFAAGENGYCKAVAFISCYLSYAAYINFGLTVLNLIPIPPLDGYHALLALVPNHFYNRLTRLELHSVYVILGLVLVCSFFKISPVSVAAQNMFSSVDGVFYQMFHN